MTIGFKSFLGSMLKFQSLRFQYETNNTMGIAQNSQTRGMGVGAFVRKIDVVEKAGIAKLEAHRFDIIDRDSTDVCYFQFDMKKNVWSGICMEEKPCGAFKRFVELSVASLDAKKLVAVHPSKHLWSIAE